MGACTAGYDPQVEGTRHQYMFDLMLLAKDGDTDARRAMYAAYREDSWHVDECFVELDGIAGFLFVAERAGALPDTDDVRWSASDFFESSCEFCGPLTLQDAFEKAARENPAIAAFRTAVEGWDPPKHQRPPRPTDHADERVRNAALVTLEGVRDPRVRALAFEAQYRGERAAHLLVENYEPGDEVLVASWIREATDPEDRHGLQLGALSFFTAHPHRAVEIPVWELLYESGDCGFCRGSVVRRLIEIDALRDDLRAECAWDAFPEIRESVT